MVEQDHRAVKRVTRPLLGSKTFCCTRILLAEIEVTHMVRKGQSGAIKDRACVCSDPLLFVSRAGQEEAGQGELFEPLIRGALGGIGCAVVAGR